MTMQQLVYGAAVPVNESRHAKWFVDVGKDYGFSRNVNSVPLTAVEFPSASDEYAIVFGGTGDTVMPAVILGARADQNNYVDEAGNWKAKYVPAFLRRYPFVFSSNDEGKTFTLCIDEEFPGFNQDGKGAALFNEDHKPTEYVDNVLKFLQQYQVEFNRTQQFCKKLKDLNLLRPMQAQINLDSGEKMVLTGFSVVDRERLKTLSAEALSDLLQSDDLELIFIHMQSMRNFGKMREMINVLKAESPVAADEASPNDGDGGDDSKSSAKASKGNGKAAAKKK